MTIATAWLRSLLLATMLAAFVPGAYAIDREPAFKDDPAMQMRYDRLIRQLRCVQCRSESIADSNVDLASDLRRQVRESIRDGRSDAEILQFMTDRYGDYVLFNPPVKPLTWLLWGAPVLLILIGGCTAGVVIVRRSRLPDNESPELSRDELDQGAS